MSLRRIPEKFLNTTLHIIRDISSLDDIGDAETVRTTAYDSIKSNVQPWTSRVNRQEIEYEIQGKVIKQTHAAYFNRFNSGVKRTIYPGDYAIDLETDNHYLILAVLEYQAARRTISDSHHFKLAMSTTDGRFDLLISKTLSSKARIQ
jgi:hypothetical protein